MQRLALRTRGWFAVVTAGLSGNVVTDSLPGGDAAGAAVQFSMLTAAADLAYHLRHIYRKLGVSLRTQLARKISPGRTERVLPPVPSLAAPAPC